jgi:hypothetical protein
MKMNVRTVRKKYDTNKIRNGVVRAGWFNDVMYSDGTPVAYVARWNEYGTYNAPARPFMRPMLHQHANAIRHNLKVQYQKALTNNTSTRQVLELVGWDVRNKIQDQILATNSPPNAKITIEGGWMRNKKSGKWFYVIGKGGKAPLRNTNTMLNTVNFQVEEYIK